MPANPTPLPQHRPTQGGFTLVELLVVLVILGLLASVATPRVIKFIGGAKTDTARVQLEQLSGALDLFRLEVGRYPSQEEGLQALIEQPATVERWNGPYMRNAEAIIDPWENPYIYRFPGGKHDYDIYSLGADSQEGGDGEDQDITTD